jgi:hypothetical protein
MEESDRICLEVGGAGEPSWCRADDGTDADSPAHVAGDLFTRSFDLILRYPWDRQSGVSRPIAKRACSSLPGDQGPVHAGLVADPTFMVV